VAETIVGKRKVSFAQGMWLGAVTNGHENPHGCSWMEMVSENARCQQRKKWHSLAPGDVAAAVAAGNTGSRDGNTSAAPELALVVP
jgi:hypothetical protein